jgi:hypothetical protein
MVRAIPNQLFTMGQHDRQIIGSKEWLRRQKNESGVT